MQRKKAKSERIAALLSVELLLVLPILAVMFLGMIEFSLLLMGVQRVQSAANAACRVATLPIADPATLDQSVRDAAVKALGKAPLVAAYQISYDAGQYAGDPVAVEVVVPMTAAAPDLLAVLGLSLQGRQVTAQTVMRKQ